MRRELAWEPRFDIEAGLRDSYSGDHALRGEGASPDFSGDAALLG